MWKQKLLSHVWLFATPWIIQSMEFSRPEYFLQGIFPTQGSNRGLPHWRRILCQLSCKGSLLLVKTQQIFHTKSFRFCSFFILLFFFYISVFRQATIHGVTKSQTQLIMHTHTHHTKQQTKPLMAMWIFPWKYRHPILLGTYIICGHSKFHTNPSYHLEHME